MDHNRENLQSKSTEDSVVLSLYITTNGKSNNYHAPLSTSLRVILHSLKTANKPEGPKYEKYQHYVYPRP